jgi:hypothetical protein
LPDTARRSSGFAAAVREIDFMPASRLLPHDV